LELAVEFVSLGGLVTLELVLVEFAADVWVELELNVVVAFDD
jgi:hypothetical protein